MDDLKRQHEFITEFWKLIKRQHSYKPEDAGKAIEEFDELYYTFNTIPYAEGCIVSYMSALDKRLTDYENQTNRPA